MGFTQLSNRQRLDAATVGGRAEWLSMGPGKVTPREKAIAQILGITDDPIVLGHEMGGYLHRSESLHPEYGKIADLLRDCGADQATAHEMLDWNRQRVAAQIAAAARLRAEGGARFEMPQPGDQSNGSGGGA